MNQTKKPLVLLALLILLLTLIFTACGIISNENKLIFTSNGDGTCYVSGFIPGKGSQIVIPSTSPDGDTVTSIGNRAFNVMLVDLNNQVHFNGLKRITIPDSVTSIGDSAFEGCGDLTSITIPDSVTSIGRSAFSGCTGLTSITMPDSVTSIGSGAFSGCNNLQYNEYDNGYYLGNASNPYVVLVKAKDTSITSCTIHEKTKFIHSSAFRSEQIYIQNGVITIHEQFEFSGLTSITIPDSVTSIGEYAFEGCYSLIEVQNLSKLSIEAGVTENGYVGYYAKHIYSEGESYLHTTDDGFVFYDDGTNIYLVKYNGNLTKLTLLANYNGKNYEIYRYAFSGCTGLTSITMPDSVTSIGERAFYDCSRLTSITMPDSVTSIGERAFSGCTGLTSITIPDSVTSIGEWAFDDCTGLTSITIPDGVASIRWRAFSGCSSLKSITIPGSVTSIESSAFSGCSSLTGITIPNSVTSIGSSAFEGCTGLTSITIPDGVASIGSSAFEGCTGLTSITIPNSVTSIGFSAFYGCTGLTSITFHGTKAQWNTIKGWDWNDNTGSYTITCTDGTISK